MKNDVTLWGSPGETYFVRSEPSPYGEGYHKYVARPVADDAALIALLKEARRKIGPDSTCPEHDEYDKECSYFIDNADLRARIDAALGGE